MKQKHAQKASKKTKQRTPPPGEGAGIERKLHDPIADHLQPVYPLDLSRVKTVDDLVRQMADTAFTGRQLGEAADVLEAMARD